MSMQKIVLETKDGELVHEIELPAQNEPDAIIIGANRVFIRRPMEQPTEPAKKNDPERYFEAATVLFTPAEDAPKFDQVTETKPKAAASDHGRKPEDDEDDDSPIVASGRRR